MSASAGVGLQCILGELGLRRGWGGGRVGVGELGSGLGLGSGWGQGPVRVLSGSGYSGSRFLVGLGLGLGLGSGSACSACSESWGPTWYYGRKTRACHERLCVRGVICSCTTRGRKASRALPDGLRSAERNPPVQGVAIAASHLEESRHSASPDFETRAGPPTPAPS